MSTHRRRLTVAGASVAACCAMLAVPTSPASAAPVFPDGGKITQSLSILTQSSGGTTCDASSYGLEPAIADGVPVLENAGPATASFTGHVDTTENGNPVGRATVAVTARASLSSVGGVPTTIDVGISGSGQLPPSPSGGCQRQVRVGTTTSFSFHTPVSGYLTFTMAHAGLSNGRVSISPKSGSLGGGDSASTTDAPGTSTSRIFLAAGDYAGSIDAASAVSTAVPNATGSFTAHGVFTPSGAQTVPISGKAAKYVALPGAVSCGTGQLTPAITAKKKRAGKIRDLTFYLGEQKVTKVKHPKKGQVVALPVPGTAPAELRVVVTLDPKGKGKGRKPKTAEATASYEACS